MSFSASLSATDRGAFDDNIDALVPSPAEIGKAGRELFDLGRELAKQIAAAMPKEDAALTASISGHAPTGKDHAFSSLTVAVNEVTVLAGAGG